MVGADGGGDVKVSDLDPGDLVVNGGAEAVFIARTQHPVWPVLQLVIWRLGDGTVSLDALSADQEVGLVIGAPTAAAQQDRLIDAIRGATRG